MEQKIWGFSSLRPRSSPSLVILMLTGHQTLMTVSRSTYCVYLGNTLISWSSKKQTAVARSSTESEYRALVHASAKIVWLKQLLGEISLTNIPRPIIWCDNISASALAINPVFHADCLMKPLFNSQFAYLRSKLEISPLPARLRGM